MTTISDHRTKLAKMLDEVSASASAEEAIHIKNLCKTLEQAGYDHSTVAARAKELIETYHAAGGAQGVEAFFHHYGLDTQEGVAMMGLAEALLRVPDADTANALIHDKLRHTTWQTHPKTAPNALVKASSVGLNLASKLFALGDTVSRVTNPLVRESIKHTMRLLGDHFVMGENIVEALTRGAEYQAQGFLLSYDMLGEGARSDYQAQAYVERYIEAIRVIEKTVDSKTSLYERPGISIKLSALYARYELVKQAEVKKKLLPRLMMIITASMKAGIPVTIDAEEARRLDISLEIFAQVIADPKVKQFHGIGLAVQAYQLRATKVLEYVIELAKFHQRRIPVRLVKGAYWDSEIKQAQMQGLANYPVFTRKDYTDVSYLACAYMLFANSDHVFPQLATHNASTIAAVMQMANGRKSFEFQLLRGMGEGLYAQLAQKYPCRIYAPVGRHTELLAYLIRRLLENSANTSFMKALADPSLPMEELTANPIESARSSLFSRQVMIDLPRDIYGARRKNSEGCDFGNRNALGNLMAHLKEYEGKRWQAGPIIAGKECKGQAQPVMAPYAAVKEVGQVVFATQAQAEQALAAAHAAFSPWDRLPIKDRAAIFEKAADLLEKNRYEAIALCVHEAGKTVRDSIDEVREAVDFCRYYTQEAKRLLGKERPLRGPTGESNTLSLHGRGVFVCISPWNFPLAIFTGQIVAALVAGNTVIAKPAEQTSLIAAWMVQLLHKAGIPKDVLHLLPGSGEALGKLLLPDARVAGVVFTGSTETAQIINRTLAARPGAIIPLIAETGGQNAMIMDSTTLLEQAVDDIVVSAFGSAGQRCSALRILYVPQELQPALLELLKGAMAELAVGHPGFLETDIGPVIDKTAVEALQRHIRAMKAEHQYIASTPLEDDLARTGHFVAPHVFGIQSIAQLPGEVFGPILHVISYQREKLDKVIADINSSGFGLTFGIHSRIEEFADYIRQRVRAGNTYVNRSMIGAVVGVQPFGGEGLSGTGPKAGGPYYLLRFMVERTTTVNTTAMGGNRELLV